MRTLRCCLGLLTELASLSPARPQVWMAKNKSTGEFAAIKCAKEDIYSNREVAILKELSRMRKPHPNLVRLVREFEPADGAHCIALSLARGPTLHSIISKHGALGLIISQVISRQLVGERSFNTIAPSIDYSTCLIDWGCCLPARAWGNFQRLSPIKHCNIWIRSRQRGLVERFA